MDLESESESESLRVGGLRVLVLQLLATYLLLASEANAVGAGMGCTMYYMELL